MQRNWESFTTSDGVRLSYSDDGNGILGTIVFFNGGPGDSSAVFCDFAESLRPNVRTILYDQQRVRRWWLCTSSPQEKTSAPAISTALVPTNRLATLSNTSQANYSITSIAASTPAISVRLNKQSFTQPSTSLQPSLANALSPATATTALPTG